MRFKPVLGVLLAVCALACAAPAASALTISPAGSFNGLANNVQITVNGITIMCSNADVHISTSSVGSGHVDVITITNCRNATLGTVTVTATGPWNKFISAISGGIRTTWSNVSATFSNLFGCRFTLGGSQTMDNFGASPFAVRSLNPTASGSSLTVTNLNNAACLGLVPNGVRATMSGNFALSTAQTITYP